MIKVTGMYPYTEGTDVTTRPWVQEAGVAVVNQPFVAKGNVGAHAHANL